MIDSTFIPLIHIVSILHRFGIHTKVRAEKSGSNRWPIFFWLSVYLLNLFAIHFATKQLPVKTTKIHYIWEKGEDCTYEHKWSEEIKVVDEDQGDFATFQKEVYLHVRVKKLLLIL